MVDRRSVAHGAALHGGLRSQPRRGRGHAAGGLVPITVAFDDASMQTDARRLNLHRFCGVAVLEVNDNPSLTWGDVVVHSFAPNQFHEIEASAKWPAEDERPLFHKVAKIWKGDSPEELLDINASAEWHATLRYTPFTSQTPGRDLVLNVAAIVSSDDTCPGFLSSGLPTKWSTIEPKNYQSGPYRLFQNLLRVHYGEKALPRFDVPSPIFGKGDLTTRALPIRGLPTSPSPWVYGDLHYHSQGTDNEGESGLSYRSVIQSMKAMGLDFVFATEHASNSVQVTDLDDVWVDNLPDPWWMPNALRDKALGAIEELKAPSIEEGGLDARRDMSDRRFRELLGYLHDVDGVNVEVGSSGAGRVPQIFLGGEVDAIPEMSQAEKDSLGLSYGEGLSYRWGDVCGAIPDVIKQVVEYSSWHICSGTYDELVSLTPQGTYGIKDVQGLGDDYFARQHMVYLPSDGTNADAFVASTTTHYGGASRRLVNMLGSDNGAGVEGKGYVFLAHPVHAASGNGAGRLGPDIVPYSDVQLQVALESPVVLGLQLWNEDTRLHSAMQCGANCYLETFPGHVLSSWYGGGPVSLAQQLSSVFTWEKKDDASLLSSLYHGAAAWDRMNLWGMNMSMTSAISWLPTGQPRRVFMAGGSDAHGDLNYRREGAVFGWSETVDSALGKPRNLVYVGANRPQTVQNGQTTVGQTQVIEGLKSGNFVVTDGPIVRVAIDANGDGVFSDGDVPMGGVHAPQLSSSAIPVLVEWKSTPEFGPVTSVDLYVGAQSGAREGLVYAPAGAGVRGPNDGLDAKDYQAGSVTYRATNVYVDDASGKLRISVPSSQGYGGVAKVWLSRADYPVFDKVCTTETVTVPPICEGPRRCTRPHTYTIDKCTASNLATPERVFVRAFARATGTAVPVKGGSVTLPRFGYSNPVWVQPGLMFDATIPIDAALVSP